MRKFVGVMSERASLPGSVGRYYSVVNANVSSLANDGGRKRLDTYLVRRT